MPTHKATKTLTLNTGAKIPQVGLGTWRSTEEECYEAVYTAIKNGYKHIDTARVYQNEEAVGKAINAALKDGLIARSDLFVTTKLWCTEFKTPEQAIKNSLERLGLDYVDLYLMHWPFTMVTGEGLMPTTPEGVRKILPFSDFSYIDCYKGMQPLVEKGYTKAIGISNFNIPKIKALLADKDVTIVPACNQVELHPYLPQDDLFDYCKTQGIVLEAYSPLGSIGAPLLKEEKLEALGKKYGVPTATIAISWAVARGTVVLPKSVKPSRVISNLEIVDLSPEDTKIVSELYKKTTERFCNPNWGVDVFGSDAFFKTTESATK